MGMISSGIVAPGTAAAQITHAQTLESAGAAPAGMGTMEWSSLCSALPDSLSCFYGSRLLGIPYMTS